MQAKKQMTIVVDHEKCQGHAMCVFTAPQVYQLDEHGYNRMQPVKVVPGQEGPAIQGANGCPEGAIRILEA